MTVVDTPVYIEGIALNIGWHDATKDLSELIFDTVTLALEDADQSIGAVDSVVLAAHDLVDGRSLSSMVTAPAAGAYLREEIRFSDDAAGALVGAMTKLESGRARRSVVAAWGRSSEYNYDQFSQTLFDPIYGRPIGLNEFVLSAMRAQLYLATDHHKEQRTRASLRRDEAARANPRALKSGGYQSAAPYPLVPADLPLWADVAVALILSVEPAPIRVIGAGQSSEPYALGDRNLRALQGLQLAAGRAMTQAGTTSSQLDVVEVDGLTLIDEAMGLESIGFAAAGQGLERLADDPRCNPSGGGAAGYCPPAMGLVRIVESILQLRGEAGVNQVAGARRAMATGSSTVAGQTHTAIVVEAA
jgi:acetyl-CoA C-acetyltransferase